MKKTIFALILILATHFSLIAQTKTVLIEEGTGTWCSWCPRGQVIGEQITSTQNALVIAIHSNDPMEDTVGYIQSANLSFLPSGNIDRVALELNPLDWQPDVNSQLATIPPADISVTTTFDSSTRAISMTINADFFSDLSGDYRLGAIVVEDGVTGTTPDYDQSNSYSGGAAGPMGGWEDKPNPYPAALMVYDHVARYLATAYEGDPGSLPTSIVDGDQHTHTVSWNLPEDIDQKYTYVIGFITDANTGAILNAGRSDYLLGNSNAQPFFVTLAETNAIADNPYTYDILAHDPDNKDLTISVIGNLPTWLTLNTTGPEEASLSGTPAIPDTYTITLEVSDGDMTDQQSFDIIVSESTGKDWHFVGEQGFSNSTRKLDLELNSQNIPIILHTNANDQVLVSKYENGSWNPMGAAVSGGSFYAALALAPDDTPYIITGNTTLYVYKFEDNSWKQVGNALGNGVQIDITIDQNGTPYASFMDITTSSRGICKKWDGTNWITVGDGHFTTNKPAVWTKITTDNNNLVHVLFGTGDQNAFHSTVVQFDGNEWLTLGDGPIDATYSTYFNHELIFDQNNDLYVSLIANDGNQSVDVYKYMDENWHKIGSNLASGAGDYVSISLDDQHLPIIGFRDESKTGKTTVMNYDGNQWNLVGLAGFTSIASNHSIACTMDGTPYIAYIDEDLSDKVSVKRFGSNAVGTSIIKLNTNDLRIYPNPNKGQFILEYKDGVSYQILDIHGRLIKTQVLDNTNPSLLKYKSINLQHNNDGIYFLNVFGKQSQQFIKIILE